MLRLAVFLFTLSFCSAPAIASPSSEDYLHSVLEKLQSDEVISEADHIVDQIDVSRVSRFVLGRHARDAAPDDIEEFELRFDAYLREFLSSRSEELSNAKMVIQSSSDRSSDDSIILTRVSSPARDPMTMRWRVLQREGQWRIVDVEMHGLWLAIEQRAQIDALLDARKRSIDDLY